ncbi:MAG: hypothetical protein H7833_02065 [Magnetococcus sp. DMHC-1]|nr:hypothetical protein [Magnetococcales bacterium]
MPEMDRRVAQAAVILLVEGLTVRDDPPLRQLCPAWADLVDRHQTGRLAWPPEELDPTLEQPGLFALFGMPYGVDPEQDLPVGSLLARYLGRPDASRHSWACLGFTHLQQVQAELRCVSKHRTGQTQAEIHALAEALLADYELEGWQVHAGQHSVILLSTPRPMTVRTTPLQRVEGRTTLDILPKGRDAATLIRLLTTGQLILARHPLNRARQDQGRLTLNTPWIWGVGREQDPPEQDQPGQNQPEQGHSEQELGHEQKRKPEPTPGNMTSPSAVKGVCWTAEPLVAALAQSDGWETTILDETETLPDNWIAGCLAQMAKGRKVIIHLQAPSLLVRHGLVQERQERLRLFGEHVVTPLMTALREGTASLVVLSGPVLDSTGAILPDPSPWVVVPAGLPSRWQRFWQAGRRGSGPTFSPQQFRQEWLS